MPLPQYPRDCPLKKSLESSKLADEVNGQTHSEEQVENTTAGRINNLHHEAERFDDMVMKKSKPNNEAQCTDRTELMLRIKRGETPQWVPNENLQKEYERENYYSTQISESAGGHIRDGPPEPANSSDSDLKTQCPEVLASPFDIERPPSALHSGDFKQISPAPPGQGHGLLNTPALQIHDTKGIPRYAKDLSIGNHEDIAPWAFQRARKPPSPGRPRSAILTFSNYILKQPTTPLIQQSTNSDLDHFPKERSTSPEQGNRRHTLPPQGLRDWQFQSSTKVLSQGQVSQDQHQEPTPAACQPTRRSITFPWTLQASSPPTPGFLRSRRTSISSEALPRHHASMVGSYEESILHGRMSTAPSKPFDFQANIGVLGRGKKPRMPPHVTVPFHAVFYDWSTKTRLPSICDEPSPYVGEIDLRRSGPMPSASRRGSLDETPSLTVQESLNQVQDTPCLSHKNPARKRKGECLPPEGSYRIPERGQIQVVIKNSYKTALKLFLVPHDLTGIQPGQKTFVRQRYYSKGPIIERPVTVGAEKAISNVHSRPILRYLIHLKMCCPSKGHFCLYSNIRVVFANRVPDDKEQISKELQEPNPKYSVWKPFPQSPRNSTPPSRLTADQTFRRRSLGGNSSLTDMNPTRSYKMVDPYTDASVPPIPPIPPLLLNPTPFTPRHDIDTHLHLSQLDIPWSEANKWVHRSEARRAWPQNINNESANEDYVKLQKGDVGYGGSRSGTPQPGEGLLARRLKGVTEPRGISPQEREE